MLFGKGLNGLSLESICAGENVLYKTGYGIPCDFEQPNMCGYQNLTEPKTYWDDRDVYQTPQTLWQRTYTSIITRPNFDHTFGETGKGISPLPDMPILGSSNSAANKDMIPKIWTNGNTVS